MKKRFLILEVTAMMALGFAVIVNAAPNWSSYNFDIISSNSYGSGHYTYSHIANGKGVYGNANAFSLAWLINAPFTNSSAGWWLEGDAGGPYEFRGSGLFPDGFDNQSLNVEGTPNGDRGATIEPVNVVNGGMFFYEPDFGIAGVGFNLKWTRSYNSSLTTTNSLGFRWSHNYDWSLTPTTNVYIKGSFTNATPALYLAMGEGEARMLLKDDASNIWRNAVAPPLVVTVTSSGEYSLPLPSGYSCLFGTNGFIKEMSNAWNNALSFSYTNSGGLINLQKVTHSDGRALSFSYNSNRLSRVDSPLTNLWYQYYYNTGGELTGAVTHSSSGDFRSTYTYDTNSVHAMLQHQNPLGEVATYAYQTNASGQLTPMCIRVDVATNYYEHTVAYASGITAVTYSRGSTNAVYNYYYDLSSKMISRMDKPSDLNETTINNYDPLLQAKTLVQQGQMVSQTNDVWPNKSYSVTVQYPVNGNAAGTYIYGGISSGKGYYYHVFSDGQFTLSWTGTQWKLGSQGEQYYKTSGVYPDGGGWTRSDGSGVSINVTCLNNAITTTNVFSSTSSTFSQYDSKGLTTQFYPYYSTSSSLYWAFAWDTNWNTLISATDPEGHRAEWDYTNGSVRVERVYPATNQPVETHYAYTANGVLASITNANGHWVSYQSDCYGYPTQTVSQCGATNWMKWSILGHLKEIQLPGQSVDAGNFPNMIPRVITFDSNELGWVRKITYPDNTFETYAFNSVGALTNHVDVAGRTNILSWLPTKKLASTTRYLVDGGSNQAVTIGLAYDQQMNVLNIKDELGRAVESYQLDLQDRPVSVTNVESQVMKITWGLQEMVNQIVRFDGSTNTLAYDENSRVKQVIYPGETIAFGYYKNGLPMTTSNSFGVVSNAFDGANRLVSSKVSGLIPQAYMVNYGYYPAGQVSNVVSLAGTNSYGYDADERITTQSIAAPYGRKDSVSYSYNQINGQLAQITYSNGITCDYGYDIMDRLTAMTWRNASNQVLRSRGYSYTTAGMINRINSEDGGYVDYSYDSLDRLTREKQVNVNGQITTDIKYEFDLAGNRTKKTILDGSGNPFITVGYSLGITNRLASKSVIETNLAIRTDVGGYASEPIGTNDRFGVLWISNAVTGGVMVKPEVQGTNFWAYGLTVGMGTQKLVAAIRDMAGNVTQATNSPVLTVITNSSVQYNLAGCVTNITGTGPGYTRTVGLTWDSLYQVTTVTTNGGLAGSYKYDAAGRRSWAIENGLTNWFVYDGNQVVADLDEAGGMVKAYVWGPGIDNLLSMTVYGGTTNTYYALKDHLGSVLALTDGAGNIVESYRYDAWGRTTVYGANGAVLKASAVGNRYCWQGREYSFKAGLYYFRARWYEPVTGRWMSNDPIGISGGLNQYVFCGNNPINFVDPFGLDAVYLIDSHAVGGAGHAASAVGNNRTGWTYYSFGASGDHGETMHIGTLDNYSVRHYQTLEALRKDNPRYDKDIYYKSSERGDMAARREGNSHFNDSYWFIGQNCDDIASSILRAAGVDFPDRLRPNASYNKNVGNNEGGCK
jgi:RHS repeat-associated protein